MREGWSTFLQSKGITDGIMTRALFDEYQQDFRAKMQANGGFWSKGPKGPGGDPNAPKVDPKVEDAQINDEGKQLFTRLDLNKDGFLDREEARFSRLGTLRDFDRYDTNKDGKLSPDEFLEAYRDEQAQFGRGSKGGNAIIQPEEEVPEEEKRPVVYRAGKLPKELPSWFADLDKDKDGQVGLYEWKASGKSTSEFLEMDANGDGFLTVEEVLRHQKATQKDKPAAPGANGFGGGGNDQFGGGPPGRFGRGGWGGAAMPGANWGPRGGMPGMDRRGRGGSGRGGPGRGGPGRGRGGMPGGFPDQ
jgi:Ca2+-binding EF-hand superfamily protein